VWASRRPSSLVPLAALAAVSGPLAWPLGKTPFEVRVHTENTATARALGRALAARGHPRQVTAIGAAGAAPYFAGMPNLDTGGLNDAHLARSAPAAPIPGLPAGHQRGDGAYVLAQRPDVLVFVLGRSDVPGLELSDAGIAFDPEFYAFYQPVPLRVHRAKRRIWLPHASAAEARQLQFLAGFRPVSSSWGAAFETTDELQFTIFERQETLGVDPVRAVMAAIAAAARAAQPARALEIVSGQGARLDGAGLAQVRYALEARYALQAGDRPRAAAALGQALLAPGRLERQLRLWILQDAKLRALLDGEAGAVTTPAR
jgi:hypothetical protein